MRQEVVEGKGEIIESEAGRAPPPQAHQLVQHLHPLAPNAGPHHLFRSTSRSMVLSRLGSATGRFSLRISTVPIPANRFFHRANVGSDTPGLRQIPPTVALPSACPRAKAIRSSGYRFRFRPLLPQGFRAPEESSLAVDQFGG